MNAREQLAAMERRNDRLGKVKWDPHRTSANRRAAIERAQHRLWRQMREVAQQALIEQQIEDWPNGLPAHP